MNPLSILTGRRGAFVPWSSFALAAVLVSSSGCDDLEDSGTEVTATPDAGLFSPDIELLSTAELALGPADGDFSECESVLYEEDFPDLPEDLTVVNGRLRLREATVTSPDVWIANSADDTVSRIDGRTGLVARTYTVGDSPSRTTIDLNFDMYVANRNDGRVMKYRAADACTTAGCLNARAWNVVPFNSSAGTRGLAVDRNGTIWVGGYNGSFKGFIARLRADNGAVLESYDLYTLTKNANGGTPTGRLGIYGHVLDRSGLLWAATLSGGVMCFDTNTRASCGYFTLPGNCTQSYGITIDSNQNVWFGTWTCSSLGYIDRASFDSVYRGGIGTYPNSARVTVRNLTRDNLSHTRGVAVDPNGVVWVAASGSDRLQRYNSITGAWLGGTTTCSNPVGVGLDNQSNVWTNCISSNQARAYNFAAVERYRTSVGSQPYSYSDFTGFVARNFTSANGTWRRTYGPEQCDGGLCTFDYMEFDAIVPTGAGILVQYRTSDDGFSWSAYSTPSATTPRFVTPDGRSPRYVEIVITLRSNAAGESPTVADIELHRCPQMNAPQNMDIDLRYIVNQAANNYGMRWRFSDMSWPESRFEMVDENGVVRCIRESTTSRGMGATYSGNAGSTSGCVEEGLASNIRFTRAARGQRVKLNAAIEYTPLSNYVSYYSSVNNPTVANLDMRFPYFTPTSVRVRWCRPQNNAFEGATGALLERSTDPTFSTSHPSYTIVSNWNGAARGYASPTAACGEITDGGLDDDTVYYYRLTYRNGDGVPSQPLVLQQATPNASCCYLGTCVGICVNGITGLNGICEAPPGYETVEVTCDGTDNDCDGTVDEGLRNACNQCGPTPVEVCNGVDDDCDGVVDDNALNGVRYYRDQDGDGWGDNSNSQVACARPTGWVTLGGDCNDSNGSIHPGIPVDACNFIDDDCDGQTDEDAPPLMYYADTDRDRFGDTATGALACTQPVGKILVSGDCDDGRNYVYPGAPELCDNLDNDCDGASDETFADAAITVNSVTILTGVADVDGFCTNDYTLNICSGAVGVNVSITNTGVIPIASTSTLVVYRGALNTSPVAAPIQLGSQLAPGASISYTACVGYVFAATPIDIHARLNPPNQQSCDVLSGRFPNATLSNGIEVCDGFDNDCDGAIDESGEACGGGLECVERLDGTYICAGT